MARRKRKSGIPAVIPPGTIVEIVSADEEVPAWKDHIGTQCKTGYYNQQDGWESLTGGCMTSVVLWHLRRRSKTFLTSC